MYGVRHLRFTSAQHISTHTGAAAAAAAAGAWSDMETHRPRCIPVCRDLTGEGTPTCSPKEMTAADGDWAVYSSGNDTQQIISYIMHYTHNSSRCTHCGAESFLFMHTEQVNTNTADTHHGRLPQLGPPCSRLLTPDFSTSKPPLFAVLRPRDGALYFQLLFHLSFLRACVLLGLCSG